MTTTSWAKYKKIVLFVIAHISRGRTLSGRRKKRQDFKLSIWALCTHSTTLTTTTTTTYTILQLIGKDRKEKREKGHEKSRMNNTTHSCTVQVLYVKEQKTLTFPPRFYFFRGHENQAYQWKRSHFERDPTKQQYHIKQQGKKC